MDILVNRMQFKILALRSDFTTLQSELWRQTTELNFLVNQYKKYFLESIPRPA